MIYEGIVIKVGQVWYHPSYPGREYRISEIVPARWSTSRELGLWDIKAELYVNGVSYGISNFGALNSDFSPRGWDNYWQCDNLDIKGFTRISRKMLRKREREQIAGNILVGKL